MYSKNYTSTSPTPHYSFNMFYINVLLANNEFDMSHEYWSINVTYRELPYIYVLSIGVSNSAQWLARGNDQSFASAKSTCSLANVTARLAMATQLFLFII